MIFTPSKLIYAIVVIFVCRKTAVFPNTICTEFAQFLIAKNHF